MTGGFDQIPFGTTGRSGLSAANIQPSTYTVNGLLRLSGSVVCSRTHLCHSNLVAKRSPLVLVRTAVEQRDGSGFTRFLEAQKRSSQLRASSSAPFAQQPGTPQPPGTPPQPPPDPTAPRPYEDPPRPIPIPRPDEPPVTDDPPPRRDNLPGAA